MKPQVSKKNQQIPRNKGHEAPRARDLELDAAARAPEPPSRTEYRRSKASTPLDMLSRRGVTPSPAPLDLPFDLDGDDEGTQQLSERLEHYAFRLFLRGAILRSEGFHPAETTKFIDSRKAEQFAEELVELGLAMRLEGTLYRLCKPAASFGGTLEWFVARQLRTCFNLDAIAGVQLKDSSTGGDLDVVAVTENRLIILELKSSPPKHLTDEEVRAFLDRIQLLRPHISIFAVDTALRLSDKVIPMFEAALQKRRPNLHRTTVGFEREIYGLTPHLYAVNAQASLIGNIGRAICEGLLALSPDPY